METQTALFALVVRFNLRSGAEPAFDNLIRRTVAQIRANEPGTLVYDCHAVEGAPRQRIFYELYSSQAAFNTHEHQEYVQRFLAEREELLESYEVDFLNHVDGTTSTAGE